MTAETNWQSIERDAAAHRRSDTLFAAVQLGLFNVMREAPLTLEETAAALGTAPRRTGAFLDLLVAYGYLLRVGERYCHHPDLLALTDPQRTDNLQHRFIHLANTRSSWCLIPEALREDRSVRAFGTAGGRDEEIVTGCHAALGARGYLFMTELAPLVPLPEKARILDVGGGFGDLCRPFLERDPSATAALFEAADTVPAARRHLERLDLADRFELFTGDFVCDELPTGFDLVVLSNVLQFYDEATNHELLARLVTGLNPGGGLLVREVAVGSDRTGPLVGLEFALHIVLNSDHGRAYPPQAMEQLLAGAGCRQVQLLLESGIHYAMLGSTGAIASG